MSASNRKPCPVCGEPIAVAARKCRFCGELFDDPEEDREEPAGDGTGGLIPYKNGPALIGYYCGVFSIIPCFFIGLAGLVLGIMGLRKVARQPEVKGTVHAWIGILAGGFFGLLWLTLTIVLLIAA